MVSPGELTDQVTLKSMRIRPAGDVQLHAYLTPKALELGVAPSVFNLRGTRSDGSRDELRVHVPNSFTYLLMKLHAFRDRVDDPRKGLAAHHALDLYRIVAMATRAEYDLVRALSMLHVMSAPLQAARAVVAQYFGDDRSVGMTRLLTGAADAGLPRADVRGEEFRGALGEMLVG